MSKASKSGMAFHQGLSFSPLLMKVPKSEAVFWPGCALLNLDRAILEKTLAVLRREEPEIRLACGCCGQPTVYLFPEKAEKRTKQLVTLLRKQGVKRIYTACPNCTLQLRQLKEFEIIPVWEILARHITRDDIVPAEGAYIWHDPCPTRAEPGQQAAARQLLSISGCDCCQPEHSGCKTRCCGNFHMMAATDPEKSEKMRKNRLSEFPEDKIITSSCEGCLGAFRGEGRNTCHLLEILFGRSTARGWGNRFKTTLK